MKKITNFKTYFKGILKDEYHMTKEGIDGYFDNKVDEEAYDSKKKIAAGVGAGELLGTVGFTIYDMCNGADCGVPVIIAAGIGILTTGIALTKSNPYKNAKHEDIDERYYEEKEKFKSKTKTK